MNNAPPPSNQRPLWLLLAVLCLGTLGLITVLANPAQTAVAQLPNTEQGTGPNCRYGASSGSLSEAPFMSELGLGWIINFGSSPHWVLPPDIEYVPMIRMKQDKDVGGNRLPSYTISTHPLTDAPGGLGPLLLNYPGRLWIVGNEVDREHWQDDMEPAIYAQAYHDVYHFIKQRDPSAQVAVAGLVQVTPNRLEYLDLVWQSYIDQFGLPMPVDVWTFHVYILPEAKLNEQGDIVGANASIAVGTNCYLNRNLADCAHIKWESGGNASLCAQASVYCFAEHDDMSIFAAQVTAMRQWMKAHGQQSKPLLLSEFSLLYPYINKGDSCFLQDELGNCFPPARVNQFMQQAFEYLETAVNPSIGNPLDSNRLVQRWLWYAISVENDEEAGSASRLVYLDSNQQPIGLTPMGDMFKSEVASRSLYVNLLPSNASTLALTAVTTATISADIFNNGNSPTNTDYTVTFYRDAALTDAIDTVTVPAVLHGCAQRHTAVSVEWHGLTPGVNHFWVEVSSSQDIYNADNVSTGFVIVDPEKIYLPIMSR